MIYCIELFIIGIVFFNRIDAIDKNILLFNNPDDSLRTSYEIILPRIKRDQSPWFYPDFDRNQISCGHNVYAKLYTCSQMTQCR